MTNTITRTINGKTYRYTAGSDTLSIYAPGESVRHSSITSARGKLMLRRLVAKEIQKHNTRISATYSTPRNEFFWYSGNDIGRLNCTTGELSIMNPETDYAVDTAVRILTA